ESEQSAWLADHGRRLEMTLHMAAGVEYPGEDLRIAALVFENHIGVRADDPSQRSRIFLDDVAQLSFRKVGRVADDRAGASAERRIQQRQLPGGIHCTSTCIGNACIRAKPQATKRRAACAAVLHTVSRKRRGR